LHIIVIIVIIIIIIIIVVVFVVVQSWIRVSQHLVCHITISFQTALISPGQRCSEGLAQLRRGRPSRTLAREPITGVWPDDFAQLPRYLERLLVFRRLFSSIGDAYCDLRWGEPGHEEYCSRPEASSDLELAAEWWNGSLGAWRLERTG
jgi:hypothetical protein